MAGARAVVVIILRGGYILSISRGHDTNDWALPGGHVERGETLPEAIERELREETGVVPDIHMRWQALGTVRTGNRKYCTYFLPRGKLFFPETMRSTPFEGYVEWKRPEELLCDTCTFREYHRGAFESLDII